ncbi:5-formyltetrahydrofolate cyclo-ligase [Trichoderma longibrachiatum]|uniref:5-formyltetrahydrofolate cyclo-ligase n=1 Tax=Trichoderma longibrachiatum ATCC 18648 TaxID=983965 RepID=A0A2T4CG46_TRILO|nr:5-formyltetrahydrofolate cyclo-ligase [Trichoderma longibrachiatum ATCC 18648]
MTSPVAAAKQQLRRLLKQRLSQVSQESILAQSNTIFETLKSFKPYQDARRISIYLSMPAAEVQTDAIVRHALAAGKQVFVPYLHRSSLDEPGTPARVMDMVQLRDVRDYDGLERDSWGIPSIDPATVHTRRRILGGGGGGPDGQQATLDLILMPGVAFDTDERGCVRRLGHGKGFYDFFLNRYLATKPHDEAGGEHVLRFYGLALKEQLLDPMADEPVPMGQFDRKLHGLILGNGEIKLSPDAEAVEEAVSES